MFRFVKTTLFLILSCLTSNVGAQVSISASIDSTSIIMGQQTVIHFNVSQPQDLPLQLPVLNDVVAPNVFIVRITGDTIADGSTISINDNIVITVFEPGEYVIPPFVCRDNDKEYKTAELKLTVRDLPDQFEIGRIPAEVKDIYNPPHSKVLWIVLSVAVALLILLGFLTFYYWRNHKDDPEPYVRNNAVADSAQPEQTALELIRKIAEGEIWKPVGNEKKYFTELTDILRQYFYRRYSVNALEMTSSELIDALKKTDMPAKLRDDVRVICFTGDMTKFAKHKPSDQECINCASLAENIVLKTMREEQSETDSKSDKPAN